MKNNEQITMTNHKTKVLVMAIGLALMSFVPSGSISSTKTFIRFFSTTPVENIEATNTQSISTLNIENGKLVFSVPMQGFTFEKALMQEHFNQEKFLDTQNFPKAKYVGMIANIDEIDFSKPGTYKVNITGEMTIKDQAQTLVTTASLVVSTSDMKLEVKFPLTLADYGITFKKGKPSKNIAKTIEVTAIAEYALN